MEYFSTMLSIWQCLDENERPTNSTINDLILRSLQQCVLSDLESAPGTLLNAKLRYYGIRFVLPRMTW